MCSGRANVRIGSVRSITPSRYADRVPSASTTSTIERFMRTLSAQCDGIYEHFGLTLAAETEQLMRQWVARNSTAAHGEHRYQTRPLRSQ